MGMVAGLTDFHPKIKTTPPPYRDLYVFPGCSHFVDERMAGKDNLCQPVRNNMSSLARMEPTL